MRKILMSARQSLFANAGYLTAIEVVNSGAGFLFWGLAAKLYQPREVGLTTAIFSVAMLITGLTELGLGIGLVRYLPTSRHPQRLLNSVFIFDTVITLAVSVIYLLGLEVWSPSLQILRNEALGIGFLLCGVTSTLVTLTRMAFVAYRSVHYAFFQTILLNAARFILLVALAGYGAAGMFNAICLAMIVPVVVGLYKFLPRVEAGYRLKLELNWSDLKMVAPYSLGNFLAGLSAQLVQKIVPLMILELLGAEASGYAYIAVMFSNMILVPGMALSGSAFAEGVRAPHNSSSILSKAAVVGLIITLPATLLLVVSAPWLLGLFGPAYAQGATDLLRWLAVATPLVIVAWLYFTYLRIHKRIGLFIALSTGMGGTTLIIAAVLMPHVGLVAYGVGWMVSHGLVALLAVVKGLRSGYHESASRYVKQALYSQSMERVTGFQWK